LLQGGKIGNADVYKDTKRSLKRFTAPSNLLFTDIDQAFLNKYEVFLRKSRLAETSMSLYFRTLRALFNKAIQERLISPNDYPFKEFRISKFNTRTQKRAITKEEIKKIENLVIDPASSLTESRNYFLFSYYGQGINFIDIAHLKWESVIEDRVVYRRAKTGQPMHFKLLPPAKRVIEYYRPVTGHCQAQYIFPILDRLLHVSPKQIHYRVANVLERVNRGLKEIGKLAQIKAKITTYVARHAFATVLLKNKVPAGVIRQMLGHISLDTTQIYLDSFENEVIDLANERLL
jgi:site-specific recombinase XerD